MTSSFKIKASPHQSREGTSRRKRLRREPVVVRENTRLDVALPAKAYPFHFPSQDSGVTAQRALQWLIGSQPVADFLKYTFEKKPALFRASKLGSSRFQCLLSLEGVQRLVCAPSSTLRYGADVDVTRYTVAEGRNTVNGAYGTPAGCEAWQMFLKESCSIRLLRPQEHVDALWALCSMLETVFGTVVGSNVYLTPADSQGFAPHFDDIDAFICQVSGRKRWRVYAPRGDGSDMQPRKSSVDFTEEEMASVNLVYDTVLEAGDMLYLPRGAIHQANCPLQEDRADGREPVERGSKSGASLHVTISACQQFAWADLLLETLATAIESASHECLPLRRTIPLRFTDYVGVGCADYDKTRREAFDNKLKKSLQLVASAYPIDAAADMIAERFMRERLPPWETQLISRPVSPSASMVKRARLENWIRATGRGIARIVMDRDGELPVIVHCLNNERGAPCNRSVAKGGEDAEPAGRMTCTADEALAIDFLLKAYPKAVRVGELPLDASRDRQELADILLEIGLGQMVR
jgi:bifunctional lysine-specific demethylase and histidyl-hydroxylase NO66